MRQVVSLLNFKVTETGFSQKKVGVFQSVLDMVQDEQGTVNRLCEAHLVFRNNYCSLYSCTVFGARQHDTPCRCDSIDLNLFILKGFESGMLVSIIGVLNIVCHVVLQTELNILETDPVSKSVLLRILDDRQSPEIY
jgi:hypothetical protein